MWRRIYAIFVARNREFYRDRTRFGWNILMPFLMVFGVAFIFSGTREDILKVGVLTSSGAHAPAVEPFLETRHISFIPQTDLNSAVAKVQWHQIDLLLDPTANARYWINEYSAKGYVAERLLLSSCGNPCTVAQRQTVSGRALRYVDWVMPGVMGINIMFSSLWGVGWALVRYRRNGVLRRLQATPLSALELLSAQILSRLTVVLAASAIFYLGADLLLDFVMRGSYFSLLVVCLSGAVFFASLGLVVAARLHNEELADGILNIIAWPMLMLSGVWFSMEGAGPAAQTVSKFLPLTCLVDAARAVMVEGAGLAQVLPQVAMLTGASVLLLLLAAWLFRWD
jgi:ABC-2 type transport system permease protein